MVFLYNHCWLDKSAQGVSVLNMYYITVIATKMTQTIFNLGLVVKKREKRKEREECDKHE